MNISFENKTEIERFILLMNISLMIGLKEEILSIEEIENYIYNPYSVAKLETWGIKKEVIKLVNLGCELEDVMSLIPERLVNAINDIESQSKELLKSLPKATLPVKKWID